MGAITELQVLLIQVKAAEDERKHVTAFLRNRISIMKMEGNDEAAQELEKCVESINKREHFKSVK